MPQALRVARGPDCGSSSEGLDWLRRDRVTVSLQFDLQNFTNRAFAYNFGNPFEGTHFGAPRLVSGKLKFNFR